MASVRSPAKLTAAKRAARSAAAATATFSLSDKLLLVVSADGRAWRIVAGTATLEALPPAKFARDQKALPVAAVEGAIAAGLVRDATTRAAPYTLARYIRWLAGNSIFAACTPPLFRRGAERFTQLGRPEFAAFCLKKAREESGHARLAQRDLAALGMPANVVPLVAPPSAEAFAQRFRACVESENPVALFGFSYCLERMALERDAGFVGRARAVCPPRTRADRFLNVHSGIGSDAGHVHEQLSFFTSLAPDDLSVVVRTAYETASLLAQQPLIDAGLSDAEIVRRLRREGIELGS